MEKILFEGYVLSSMTSLALVESRLSQREIFLDKGAQSCKNRSSEQHTCQSPWVLQPQGQGSMPSRSLLDFSIFANIPPDLKPLLWSVIWVENLWELHQLVQWDVPRAPTLQEGCISSTLHSLWKTAKLYVPSAKRKFWLLDPQSKCLAQNKYTESLLPMRLLRPGGCCAFASRPALGSHDLIQGGKKSQISCISQSWQVGVYDCLCAMPWTLPSTQAIFTNFNNQKKAFHWGFRPPPQIGGLYLKQLSSLAGLFF